MTTIPVSTVGQVGQERNPEPISRFENDCSLIVSGRSAIITSYSIAAAEFAGQLEKLRVLVESELRTMEKEMDAAGARTPDRVPVWLEE